jgi:monoamine oxidase
MTRKEFMKLCGILGMSLPISGPVFSCSEKKSPTPAFNGKVIIIGAGAGGLSAGYLLQQQGIEFQILEASSRHGGRMKINTDFVDFPLPLGAEWIETEKEIFKEIVNDPGVPVNIETVADDPDLKFINYSWQQFFDTYIVPSIQSRITYDTPVQSIEYHGPQVVITTTSQEYRADKVVVSVPLKIMQDRTIDFLPDLPASRWNAIDQTTIWEGFKAFFEFSEKFYPEEYQFDIQPVEAGQKIYYNAAHGQATSRHILGLFAVGMPAKAYLSLSGEEIKQKILEELDTLFGGKASPHYLQHLYQNWNDEPFIRSGYMTDHADWRTVRELGKPVGDRLFFAGGPYTDGEDWVSVHAAARSARQAIRELTKL